MTPDDAATLRMQLAQIIFLLEHMLKSVDYISKRLGEPGDGPAGTAGAVYRGTAVDHRAEADR